jgi:small-conductance mechanosensitive channel
VDYNTTPEQLEWIATFMRDLIVKTANARLERAHFFKFGESSLDFEVAYWVKNPDYGVYMDIQQALNIQLMTALAERKIEFAYPTRTIKLDGPVSVAPEAAAITGAAAANTPAAEIRQLPRAR